MYLKFWWKPSYTRAEQFLFGSFIVELITAEVSALILNLTTSTSHILQGQIGGGHPAHPLPAYFCRDRAPDCVWVGAQVPPLFFKCLCNLYWKFLDLPLSLPCITNFIWKATPWRIVNINICWIKIKVVEMALRVVLYFT